VRVHDGSASEQQDLAAVSVDEVGGDDGGHYVDHTDQGGADNGLVEAREAEDRGGVEHNRVDTSNGLYVAQKENKNQFSSR